MMPVLLLLLFLLPLFASLVYDVLSNKKFDLWYFFIFYFGGFPSTGDVFIAFIKSEIVAKIGAIKIESDVLLANQRWGALQPPAGSTTEVCFVLASETLERLMHT